MNKDCEVLAECFLRHYHSFYREVAGREQLPGKPLEVVKDEYLPALNEAFGSFCGGRIWHDGASLVCDALGIEYGAAASVSVSEELRAGRVLETLFVMLLAEGRNELAGPGLVG